MVVGTRAGCESVVGKGVSIWNWGKVVKSISKAYWEWLLCDCNKRLVDARVQQAKSETS